MAQMKLQNFGRFFGSRGGMVTSTTLEIFKDCTYYEVAYSGAWDVIATYTIEKDWLANAIYKTNAVSVAFRFASDGAAGNDFRLKCDGVVIRTWGQHGTSMLEYSTILKMSNSQNHTITIESNHGNGNKSSVDNFIMTATVEVI